MGNDLEMLTKRTADDRTRLQNTALSFAAIEKRLVSLEHDRGELGEFIESMRLPGTSS